MGVCCVSLDHFGFVFSNFVLLCLVLSVLSQEIGWEERLRNDLFCVDWDVKPYFSVAVCWCCGRVMWSSVTLSHCWGLSSSFHSKTKFSTFSDLSQHTLCSSFAQNRVYQHRVRWCWLLLLWDAVCCYCCSMVCLSVCLCVSLLVMIMSCAKMAEPVEMPFECGIVGPKKPCISGVRIPRGKALLAGHLLAHYCNYRDYQLCSEYLRYLIQ